MTALPRWALMWLTAIGLFAFSKALTIKDMRKPLSQNSMWVYLLGWPGMDPEKFLSKGPPTAFKARDLWTGIFSISIGVILFTIAGSIASSMIRGVLAMVAVVMILHFGLFQVLAAVWVGRGFHAASLMNAPYRATTLATFWGHRWNRAFRDLTHRFIFRPLTRRLSSRVALLTGFLVSGLIHELVITVPAGGGYGGPTLYFSLQGVGLLTERHAFFKTRHTLRKCFCWLILLLPTPFLFPQAFIQNIMAPFTTALTPNLLPEFTMPIPEKLLIFAGLMHLGLIMAGLLMPKVTNLKSSMNTLPPFPRQLFWMYYAFIGLCLVSFGSASTLLAPQLASGTPLARSVCVFLAAFWTLRLVFATWFLDLGPYLTTRARRLGYLGLNTAFALFIPIYIYSAIAGGAS